MTPTTERYAQVDAELEKMWTHLIEPAVEIDEAADINLTDQGFKRKEGTPENFKICKKGSWNERMIIETLFSLWTRICNMKKSFQKTVRGFKAKISYLVALTNIIMRKNEELGFTKLSMVQWAL